MTPDGEAVTSDGGGRSHEVQREAAGGQLGCGGEGLAGGGRGLEAQAQAGEAARGRLEEIRGERGERREGRRRWAGRVGGGSVEARPRAAAAARLCPALVVAFPSGAQGLRTHWRTFEPGADGKKRGWGGDEEEGAPRLPPMAAAGAAAAAAAGVAASGIRDSVVSWFTRESMGSNPGDAGQNRMASR